MTAPAWIEAAAVVVLACITGWYAVSTHRTLLEAQRQAKSAAKILGETKRQANIMLTATLVSAYAAMEQAAAGRIGMKPVHRLVELAEELEALREKVTA